MFRQKKIEWTDQELQRFWSWESTKEDHFFTKKYGTNILKRIRQYIGKDASILDYGSGLGYFSNKLLKNGFNVASLDNSQEMIEATAARNAGYTKYLGANTADHYINRNLIFDVVIAIEVIEHLDDKRLESFKEHVRSLLKPEGVLILTTPNNEALEKTEVFCPNCGSIFHRWQHVRNFDRESIGVLVEAIGLTVYRTFETDFSVDKSFVYRVFERKKQSPHLVCVAKTYNTYEPPARQ